MVFGRLACNNMSIYYISHTFDTVTRVFPAELLLFLLIVHHLFLMESYNFLFLLFFLAFLSVCSLKIYNIHNEYVDFVPNLRRLFKYKVQKYGKTGR